MKRYAIAFILCGLASPLRAGLIVDPAPGGLTGSPGATVGWGFTFVDDTKLQWVSFTQSFTINETNPSLGAYSDLIGPQGGPDNFVVDAGFTWTQAFMAANGTGLGSFTIDPGAVPGAADSGFIRVAFDVFGGNPATCLACTPTPFSVDVPFSVTVTNQSQTPEPSSLMLLLGGALVFAGLRRRRFGL